jgi:hypothetical protein
MQRLAYLSRKHCTEYSTIIRWNLCIRRHYNWIQNNFSKLFTPWNEDTSEAGKTVTCPNGVLTSQVLLLWKTGNWTNVSWEGRVNVCTMREWSGRVLWGTRTSQNYLSRNSGNFHNDNILLPWFEDGNAKGHNLALYVTRCWDDVTGT